MTIPKLSVSGVKTYLECREEYRYAYADRIRPRSDPPDAAIGKVLHAGLAQWWTDPSLSAASAMAAEPAFKQLDPYQVELCRVVMVAYHERWYGRHPYTPIRAERPFRVLREGYAWVGVLDGHCGSSVLVEHKTTGADFSEGSDYWVRLKADLQVGLYFEAAESMGLRPEVMVYDVIKRPDLKPLKATPPEARKYTKGTAKEPSRLYAGQRETDETVSEYGQRVAEKIASDPDAHFRRAEIVRLEHERQRASRELDALARDALRVLPGVPEPRTGASGMACKRCPYTGPCLHGEDFDMTRFEVKP